MFPCHSAARLVLAKRRIVSKSDSACSAVNVENIGLSDYESQTVESKPNTRRQGTILARFCLPTLTVDDINDLRLFTVVLCEGGER